PVSYQWQWQLNGTDIPGATNGDLIITNATVANAGKYQAWVSFHFGLDWAASSLARVTILPPVQIPTRLTATIPQSDGSFILTANDANGAIDFIDPNATSSPARFYRLLGQ